MKATDLMIGDWVNYQPGDTPQYMKVGMVSGYDIQLDLYREGGIEVAAQVWFDEENYIQPIPLTPEILEKNGFERVAKNNPFDIDYILTDEEYFDLTARTIQEGLWQIKYVNVEIGAIPPARFNISYVHELQHALRLCGIEKEIEL